MLNNERVLGNPLIQKSQGVSAILCQETSQPCLHCMVVFGDTLISNHTRGQCTKHSKRHQREISEGAIKYIMNQGQEPCLKCMKVYKDRCVFKHTIASCPNKHYLSYFDYKTQPSQAPQQQIYSQIPKQQSKVSKEVSIIPISVLAARRKGIKK